MNDTLSAECHPSEENLATLQKLTREYAKFSRDFAGLGHVLGGSLVFLLVYLLRRDSLSTWLGFLLGTTPLLWIIFKEWLHKSYYQFSGRVTQPARRWHDWAVGILSGLFAAAIVATLLAYRLNEHWTWKLGLNTVVCVVLLVGMPVIAWRYLRAPYEFVTGNFLLALSTFLLSGNPQIATRFARALGFVAVVVALVMVLAGYAEHMKFLKLRRNMKALKGPA
ncbi:MAG TPA: hypothetical protein VGR55_13815 [Candidatus Acidoferrum sp.]|nr:hypothetical protein [Candidatus Acidoferrum sp.]